LLFGLTLGLFLVFATPPYQVPDEDSHFFRAYQLSTLNLFADKEGESYGGEIPIDLIESVQILKVPDLAFDYDKKFDYHLLYPELGKELDEQETDFHAISAYSYSPASYLPQIVSLWISRSLDLSPLLTLYLARLSVLLTSIMMIYVAIKTTPVAKWIVLLIALMPTTVFLMASASQDALIISSSILYLSMILRLRFDTSSKLDKKTLLALLSLGALIPLFKPVYIPLLLFLLVIPKIKFKNSKSQISLIILNISIATVLTLIWLFTNSYLEVVSSNQSSQFHSLIENPIHFFTILIDTYFRTYGIHYAIQMVGILGLLSAPISFLFHFLPYTFALTVAVLSEDFNFNTKERLLSILVFLSSAFLISISLFLIWTQPHTNYIDGIQGRYFTPIILTLFFPLITNKIKLKIQFSHKYLYLFLFLIYSSLLTALTLILRFYEF